MSNKTKNKKIKQELNLLDNLISDNAEAFLANEVHHGSLKRKRCELRAKKTKGGLSAPHHSHARECTRGKKEPKDDPRGVEGPPRHGVFRLPRAR